MPLALRFALFALSCCLADSACDFYDITARDPSGPCCESWRFNVEVGNRRDWATVPLGCKDYVRDHLLGGQYDLDVEAACEEAGVYARGAELNGSGMDAWIFDIDDTALSNLPYYLANGLGTVPFNRESWHEWETQAIAPALAPVLSLYNQLIDAQWAVFFLTGRREVHRNVTIENLLRSGYNKGWAGLIFRQEADIGITAVAFKSAKRLQLQQQGYHIWGSMGDQWSDLTGFSVGERTFKLPNCMYYIP